MPYVEVPGARLSIADAGRIDAPTLLFVHGNVMNLHMWDALTSSLESQFRCVRWDLRLHGATVDDGESFSYWDAARDGMAVLDHLDLPSATWVGHSQGGFTALRAALLDPNRVERLVLIDTMSHSFGAPDLAQMGQVREGFAGGNTEATARLLLELLLDSPQYEQAWLPQLVGQGGERVAKAISVLMDADDITDRVETIRHPALVIHGRGDIPIPFDRGEELVRALPGSGAITGID
ncbi:alpha/beta fold hydrolase [Mycobacterium sp.]|uniref:alpha/beta fold hydrolase n=1 Tax=Mycobacterium sp. TaxID=1785 RepID=UPI003F95A3BE